MPQDRPRQLPVASFRMYEFSFLFADISFSTSEKICAFCEAARWLRLLRQIEVAPVILMTVPYVQMI